VGIFDGVESERRKKVGMERAAWKRKVLLRDARRVAASLALTKGVVTADDVGDWYEARGIDLADLLGPASGSIFKTKDFEFTGRRVNSKRVKNHGRELKVWRLLTNRPRRD
jgi:hypothetical protein